jgi:protein-S-isoprenylcysteine O-methyltransferase Ste14
MTAPAEDPQKDHPDVVVFPPILLFALIAVGVILDRFFPLGILAQLPAMPRLVAGAILLVFGASFPVMTRLAFARAGTNVRPDQPTTALVTSGLFAHVRNPVYEGGTLALLGLALLLRADWIVLLMIPALLLPALRRGVARGAISRAEVRPGLSRLQGARSALRLEILRLHRKSFSVPRSPRPRPA